MSFIILLLLFPTVAFSQFPATEQSIEQELSPEVRALVEQAKQELPATVGARKIQSATQSFFNLAITSRFDFGMMLPVAGEIPFQYDVFNLTSLELYFSVSKHVRLLATARFSTPLLNDQSNPIRDALYKQRLGWGAGISAILSDGRNAQGKGLMTALNLLVAGDYTLGYHENHNKNFSNEDMSLYRLEMAFRFNKFVAKNFGFVFGLELGGGFTHGEFLPQLGSDGFPSEPLNAVGDYLRWNFTAGASVGLIF